MENVRKHRDIQLVKTDKRRNQLVSKPNYFTRKWFSESLLGIEMKKIKVKINKPVYLGLSILEISKTLIHEFWYDYIKPKYEHNAKLCYMDIDSFVININTEDVYEGIADDVEKTYTSYYEINRPLPIGKTKKVIGLMKDEFGEKNMTKSVALRPKTYSYLIGNCNTTIKKAKGSKKCIIQRILKFDDWKNCLLNNEVIPKSQQGFKSEAHNVYTEKNNKIALSCNHDKRLQTFDRITSYSYGPSVQKACKTEILNKYK